MIYIKIKNSLIINKTIILLTRFLIVILVAGIILLYGPIPNFREWLITTAMTTMSHQYLATWFYSDETIKKVLEKHTIEEFEENTDTSLIDANILFNEKYTSDYEKLVVKGNQEGKLYKVIEINANTYSGYLVAIYDSSKIRTAVSNSTEGEYLTEMSKKNNAIIAINGGVFEQVENNIISKGITISDGNIINKSEEKESIIGFTEDNKLFLGRVNIQEAIQLKIKNCVTFEPFLIMNGKRAKISRKWRMGNGT